MYILAKNKFIPFVKGSSHNRCDYCIFGEQHRVSFNNFYGKKSTFLERVCSNVCGHIEIRGLRKAKCFLTFIDETSRKIWAYLLKSKNQMFNIFQ